METQAAINAEDERAIHDVLHRYCAGIDRRDWTLFRSCFTDDLHADYGAFGNWNSGEAITAGMEQMHLHLGPTLHRLSNIMASATPGGAEVRSYVDAILNQQDPAKPPSRGIGYYEDELVQTTAGWKIARRRFVPVHLVV